MPGLEIERVALNEEAELLEGLITSAQPGLTFTSRRLGK
jgi:hypothetical protein